MGEEEEKEEADSGRGLKMEVETQVKSGKGPQVRYTCWACREQIGHKDLVSLKQKMEKSILELYYCTSCAIEPLKEISFEQAVEGQAVLKWIGKTWSFEMPLYKKDAWSELRKRLREGDLFPEDSLISEGKQLTASHQRG